MRQFTDTRGGSWVIDLTIGAVERVRKLSDGKYNLWKPEQPVATGEFSEPTALQTVLMLDFSLLAELLYLILEPQAAARGITAEQFAESLDGTVLLAARDHFRQEWRDFFQKLQRPDQALSLEKMGAWLTMAEKKLAEAAANPVLATLDQRVLESMDRSLGNSLGNLRAQLESTPGG